MWKCDIIIDIYLSKKKKLAWYIYKDMCKTIRHAVNACSFLKCKLCFVLKWTLGTKSIYERDVK